jgi:hypothetical protein
MREPNVEKEPKRQLLKSTGGADAKSNLPERAEQKCRCLGSDLPRWVDRNRGTEGRDRLEPAA